MHQRPRMTRMNDPPAVNKRGRPAREPAVPLKSRQEDRTRPRSVLWIAQAPDILAQGTGKGVVGGLYDESLRGLFGAAIDQGKGQPNHEDGRTEHRRHGTTGSGEQEIGGRPAGGCWRVQAILSISSARQARSQAQHGCQDEDGAAWGNHGVHRFEPLLGTVSGTSAISGLTDRLGHRFDFLLERPRPDRSTEASSDRVSRRGSPRR